MGQALLTRMSRPGPKPVYTRVTPKECRGGCAFFDSFHPSPPGQGKATALNFVIPTGALAQGRDLQFALMEKRNSEAIRLRSIGLCRKRNCRSPPCASAPVGMTKFRAVAYLGLGGRGSTEPPLQQPPRFRLRAFSLMHATICAVQKAVVPLIRTSLTFSRPLRQAQGRLCGTDRDTLR
jgi:hypothetical protein